MVPVEVQVALMLILSLISGFIVGRGYEANKWSNRSINDFVETERLRTENKRLKEKLNTPKNGVDTHA